MNTNRPKSPLERFLTLFTDVRSGEGSTVLLLTLNIFLILTAYYFIKPVREALILSEGSAELKSYSSAGQSILLLGVVPLYAWLASKLPRKQLINYVTLFFIACLGIFFSLAIAEVPISVVFFLWVGIFNVSIVAQFWSFANDVYSTEEGNRLFPIVVFGMSSGAVLGSFLAGQLIEPIGVFQLLLVAGGILGLALILTNIVDNREKSRKPGTADVPAAASTADEPLKKGGAFQLVLGNRYLLYIALLILVLNLVNTNGEYILSRTVDRVAEAAVAADTTGELTEAAFTGKFYSDFFFYVNLLGLLLQLFLVSRIFKFFGLRIAILILPIISLGAYSLLAFFPVLSVVRWAKTMENATDYSLMNTVRNVLFLPTTREQKYKAKQAIDTFFVRAGDVLSAALVFIGSTWIALQTEQFALVNVGLVLVWLVLAVLIGRKYVELTKDAEEEKRAA